jgi:hypothetical protein
MTYTNTIAGKQPTAEELIASMTKAMEELASKPLQKDLEIDADGNLNRTTSCMHAILDNFAM